MGSNLYSVKVNPFNHDETFAGSSKALFRSIDGGRGFKRTFVFKGDAESVNDLKVVRG